MVPRIDSMDEWDEARYRLLRVLRPGRDSQAQLEVYADRKMGSIVAVKRFFAKHLCGSPVGFRCIHPGDLENPWEELRFAHALGLAGGARDLGISPYRGIFRNTSGDALIASDWMPLGDLHSFIRGLGEPGAAREAQILPVFQALMSAVASMHGLGLAHCDLSVENVLLRASPKNQSPPDVVLIDFAMALSGEETKAATGVRGKAIYRAPEIYSGAYDACAADLFACGVTAYALATGRYPWGSTAPGQCRAFRYVSRHGFRAFLGKHRVPDRAGVPAAEVLSPGLAETICTLLSPDPCQRGLALHAVQD